MADLLKCIECGRIFDPLDSDDAAELVFGHDCEVGDDIEEFAR